MGLEGQLGHRRRAGGGLGLEGPLHALLIAFSLVTTVAVLAPAASALAAGGCSNEQARVANNSTQLPDCRVYELVSPAEDRGPVGATPFEHKGPVGSTPLALLANSDGSGAATAVLPGGNLFGALGSPLAVLTDGSGVFWESQATPPGTGALPDGLSYDTFLASRSATGWSTRDIAPYAFPFAGFSEQEEKFIVGASTDGSAALVSTNALLTPSLFEAPQEFRLTRERFLYRVPTGGSPPELISHGEHLLPGEEPTNSGGGLLQTGIALSASSDLSAVAFVSEFPLEASDTCDGSDNYRPPRLESSVYLWKVWRGGEAPVAHTIVSLPPGCTAPNVSGVPAVLPDGRPIVYPNPANPLGSRHYVSGPLVVNNREVSEIGALTPLAGPGGGTLLAVSSDGATAYVQSSEALTPGAHGANIFAVSTSAPQAGEEGALHGVVCVSCASDGLDVTYVGSSQDSSQLFFSTDQGLWSWDGQTATLLSGTIGVSQVLASQNGQFVVGITSQALSAGDTDGGPDIYEFAVGQSPKLISSGTSAHSVYRLEEVLNLFYEGGSQENSHAAGGVSNDGLRVVYDDAPEGSGPQVIDEWVDGETRQISPQGSPNPYGVQAVVGDQLQDIFFLANEPIVPGDANADDTDVYDAREGGGFAPCTPGNPAPPPGVASCLPGSTQDPTGPPATPFPPNLLVPGSAPRPVPSDGEKAVVKPLTRAQELAKALKACRVKRNKHKRAVCEAQARKKYATKVKAKKSHRRGK
jgi:hypothetical protein